MEENKKRPLSEEELEQVAGGVYEYTNSNGVREWKCSKCKTSFSTLEEAKAHEANCRYGAPKPRA